jgi:glyoxylase-like metal-dependent hydrolase (beta-lactamase superfamily II)
MLFTGDHAGIYCNGWIVPTTPPPFYLDETLKSFEKLKKLDPEYLGFTHFGFSENELEKAKKKIIEWARIAEDVLRNGGDAEDLYARLRDSDDDFVKILEYYRDSRIIQKAFKVGLAGFMDGVRKSL